MKKITNKLLAAIILVSSISIQAQSPTQNYVLSRSYKTPTVTEYIGANLIPVNVTDDIQYIDGLGRPMQSIQKSGSPLAKDIIQPFAYDAYGRVSKEYLPFTLGSNSGNYTASATTQQSTFYNGTAKVAISQDPYAEKVYENSPLDRVREQSAPGSSWKLGSGHTVKNEFLYNTSTDQIRKLGVDGSGNLVIGSGSNEFYAANLLTGTIIEDEHGQKTMEYKDVLGNVVMKQSGIIGSDIVRTYYVYDDFNNLRYVLPPESFKQQAGYSGNTTQWLADHAYQYKYDERQRLFFKKLPGAEPIYYVYDPMNKPILEQDGNLRSQSTATAQKWKYMKYDALGRVVESGVCTLNPTVVPTGNAHRVSADAGVRITSSTFPTTYLNTANFVANYFNNFTNFYVENICGSTLTNYVFPPNASCTAYARNMYDDYNGAAGYCGAVIIPTVGDPYLAWPSNVLSMFNNKNSTGYTELSNKTMNYRTRGLSTQTEVLILDGGTDINSQINFYDNKSQVVEAIEYRGNNGDYMKVINTAYNFEGLPTLMQTYYENTIIPQNHRITERYVYDHNKRLVNQYIKPGNDAEKMIASLGYNELGQLVNKNLHNTATNNTGENFLQYVDYRYNVRGWLKSINNSWLDNDSTYAMTPTNITYSNSKLTQLQNIATLYLTNQASATTQLNTLKDEIKTKYLNSADANHGAARYVMESFEGLGNIDHVSYSVIHAFFVESFTNLVNGQYLNNELTDLFGQEIEYEKGNAELNASGQFNGNISSIRWKNKKENLQKAYGYTYDNLNRLTQSKFAVFSAPAFGSIISTADFFNNYFKWNLQVDRYNENNISYDLNGNIKTLQRKGQTGGTASAPTFSFNSGTMDNLTYTYTANQLKVVNDAAAALPVGLTLEFKDGFAGSIGSPDYFYDANGNLTQDKNKNISSITYNILNLPQLITFSSGNKIEFIYDATGQKLQKKIKNSSNVVTSTKYYLGAAEFAGSTTPSALEAIYFTEGRLTKSGANPYKYEYTLKDHLGNARVNFCDLNGNNTVDVATEVLQENNYYPFGLQHNPNIVIGTANKYQYNGKEFNDEFGLNELDYGARFYMPDMARWSCVDPKASKFPHESPYVFVGNNPIIYIDPDGREKIIALDKNKKNDQNIISGAEKYKDDGAIHIFGHGNTKGMYLVMDGKNVNIESPEQLNNFLNKHSETWQNKGDDKPMIVLHSCNTGRDQKDGSASFTEKVSESKLFKDVTVVAPNERDYFNENGEVGTYKAKYADKNGVYKTNESGDIKSKERSDTPGSWRIFKNGEQTGQYRGDWKPKEQPTLMDNLTKRQKVTQ